MLCLLLEYNIDKHEPAPTVSEISLNCVYVGESPCSSGEKRVRLLNGVLIDAVMLVTWFVSEWVGGWTLLWGEINQFNRSHGFDWSSGLTLSVVCVWWATASLSHCESDQFYRINPSYIYCRAVYHRDVKMGFNLGQ